MSLTNYEGTDSGIVDDYFDNKTRTAIKYGRYIPTSVIVATINKIKKIKHSVQQIMKEEILISPEESHYDEETGENVIDTPALYNAKPVLRGELTDLTEAIYPECSKTALDYAVDKIIDNATSAGTWSAFKKISWS